MPTMRLRRLAKFVRGRVPAGDPVEHVGGLGVEILEDAPQELADDERVHQRGLVLGFDGVADRIERHVPAIHLVREVNLVGAAAIVVGAAGADREAQRHRLQRPGLVAWNLEALHLRSERDAVVPDRLGRTAAALGQQVADALAAAHELDRPQHRVTAPEGEPGLIEPSAFDTLHREGDRAAGADRIDAEVVAEPGCAEHGVGVAHAAERTQREQALVLEPDTVLVADRVDVLAPDGAGDAAGARAACGWCGSARARCWPPRRTCRSGSCASAALRGD